ncbi:hypothetical protein ANO11243_015720 [Dothideomycetidae sp. 11243]|nr:hypothetical protein ANO11243_015720 [fungal sp. No.11243]
MAASDIDQKILCRVAKEAALADPSLASAFYQVLGLSVILSRKLYKARKPRVKDVKPVRLYHQIIWLAREGLAITESLILPFCQGRLSPSPRCRVMAAKLRASFYHIFCLFHNQPAINNYTPTKTVPHNKSSSPAVSTRDARHRQAILRDTIPSMTSDASYITNPYAVSGPAQTTPPPYPLPPIPPLQSSSPYSPLHSPGLHIISPIRRSPPSAADFIMPPLNFVPATTTFFSQANTLARHFLSGSDPLRLSIAFESCAFTLECAKDLTLARDRARTTIRAVYNAPEGMEDADFQDAATLVQAVATIANRTDLTDSPVRSSSKLSSISQHISPEKTAAHSSEHKMPNSRLSSSRPRKPRSHKFQPQSSSDDKTRRIDGVAPALLGGAHMHSHAEDRSHNSSVDPRSDKERKRRRVELAEQDLERRSSTRSQSASAAEAD